MHTFMRLVKIDEDKRIVTARATQEIADKADEILDYSGSKPEFEKWSSEIEKASKGKSKGNVREMHGNTVGGRVNQIFFNDAEKAIDMEIYVISDSAWKMCKEGGYTGLSIGGSYVRKWQDPENPELTRFIPRVVEVSLVDNPCVPTATFEAIKADGTVEMRKFKSAKEAQSIMTEPKQMWVASDGKQFEKKADAEKHNASLDIDPAAADAMAKLTAALKKEDETEEEKKEREEKEAKEKEEADKLAAAEAKKKEEETPEEKEKREAEEKKKAEEEADKKEKKAAAIAALKKSLSEAMDSRQALDALCNIEWLLMNEAAEDEGDEGQIADLEAVIARLKAFIASEVMEGTEKSAQDVIVKFGVDNTELQKALKDLAKAGARHSKTDMEQLTKMSDHLHNMHEHATDMVAKCMDMHKCMKGMGMPGHDMEEGEENQKMAKMEAQLTKLNATNETLTDFIKGVVPEIQKLRDDINTPVVRKSRTGYATGSDTSLNKGGDEGSTGQPADHSINTNGLSPADASRKLFGF